MTVYNLTQKLFQDHWVAGSMEPGEEIGIRIDQTLTQDATGTMVMLAFEAMGLDGVKTEVSAQYVDHNLLQTDFKNPDDHLFLKSACERYGVYFSRAGGGVSHPVHMNRLGKPGKTLLGSDSHTPAAGALGMLSFGAGGLEVATAMAGEPYFLEMPEVWGVKLTGQLPPWVSAKDVILEMLRRHGVSGGRGRVLEYYGPGLNQLSAMDRHVIANMGTELGATSTVFPADGEVERFLAQQGRHEDFRPFYADPDCRYDHYEEIDLSSLVPLCAKPSSPGNVVPVSEEAGKPIYQSYIGSSANPGLRDFWMAASIVQGQKVHPQVSFDINPTTRQLMQNMIQTGALAHLIASGGRIHQTGCNGCIGMGQAPATEEISLRTVPRNFPGRSGTQEDKVYLVSPETAAASALLGEITDPRTLPEKLGIHYPHWQTPPHLYLDTTVYQEPMPKEECHKVSLRKGPNVKSMPEMDELPNSLAGPVLLKVEDDVSTDEIMPAGSRVLPFRSNIPAISDFVFRQIDKSFPERAKLAMEEHNACFVVAGENYGQGSSREHAAIAPRFLGLRVVLAKSYARIHSDNLANFGILALHFANSDDWEKISSGDVLALEGTHSKLHQGEFLVLNKTQGESYKAVFQGSERQKQMLLAGSRINVLKQKHAEGASSHQSMERSQQCYAA
ncbi:MAG: aconitate hydratase [Deltaproteobacteria bacterium]|nr:MAG: aconitate hydratase [Deltaproteobacteria bacterium]